MWCNLNTGFWNIVSPHTMGELGLTLRAVLPFAVLPVAGFFLILHRRLKLPKLSPARFLILYGLVAAFASVFSPEPLWSLYWSVAFLATIFAAWGFVDHGNPLESARQLLFVTWGATFLVAAMIAYQGRNVVFGEAATGYGILTELNGLSRASGVARWAAVPGLVCLVRAYHARRIPLIAFYLGTAAVSFFIVYRMQSRGAVFGSLAALLFALLVSSRMRRYALPFAILAIVALFIMDSPELVSSRAATYLERGQSKEEFLSMTGRTRAYGESISAIGDAPVLGRGQWADRLVIREHSHNSFLQALLNSGIVGGIPYLASWVSGWILFYKLQKRSEMLMPLDRIHLLECGTVMMFFTVRAIPETTTASFSVDLLVMVAVYVYLEALSLNFGIEKVRQMIRPYAVVPFWATRPRKPARIEVNP